MREKLNAYKLKILFFYIIMKAGISRSLSIIGTILTVISLGYAYNNSLSWKEYQEASIAVGTSFGYGIGVAGIILLASYFTKISKKWNYITVISVSYFLAFFMISIALNLYKGLTYPFQLANLEKIVGELSPDELFSITLSHSTVYKKVMAWAMIIASGLICFRNTRNIGALLSTFVLTNIVAIAWNYEYQTTSYAIFLLGCSSFILLNNYNFIFSELYNHKRKVRKYSLFKSSKLYNSLAILKVLCFVGVVVYFHFRKEESWIRKTTLDDNPIVGVWKIDQIESANIDTSQTKEFLEAEAIYFEKGVSGYIKYQDSLSMFKYHLNQSDRQFDLYDFHQFREIDMKGKYEMIHQDTMVFEGKNNKESLKIRLIRDPKFKRFLEDKK